MVDPLPRVALVAVAAVLLLVPVEPGRRVETRRAASLELVVVRWVAPLRALEREMLVAMVKTGTAHTVQALVVVVAGVALTWAEQAAITAAAAAVVVLVLLDRTELLAPARAA